MLGYEVVFISTVFPVIYNRLCVYHSIGTINNYLCIDCRLVYIFLMVHVDEFYFHHIIL